MSKNLRSFDEIQLRQQIRAHTICIEEAQKDILKHTAAIRALLVMLAERATTRQQPQSTAQPKRAQYGPAFARQLRAAGMTYAEVAAQLNTMGVGTQRGRLWTVANVKAVCGRRRK